MRDLSQRCIFSGKTENLNTVIEIVLDGEKYKVAISDEHEDQASPAAIKKRIPERLAELERARSEMVTKLEEFKMLAAELGFDLVQKGTSGLVVATEASKSKTKPVIQEDLSNKPVTKIGEAEYKVQKNARNKDKDEGLTKEEAEAALEAAKRKSQSAQGSASPAAGEASSYGKHVIPESVTVNTPAGPKVVKKPEVFAKRMQTVKGRAGVPTAIPRTLQGTDGETTITIVDTGGDRTIQNRGKQLNAMREGGEMADYSQVCRPCQGTGFHAKKPCRTCDGTGFLI